ELAQQLRGVLQVLGRELHARAAERIGHGRRSISENRDVGRHRFDERHAEPFVFAERNVHRCMTVINGKLFVGNRAGEDEAIVEQPVLRHQRANGRVATAKGNTPVRWNPRVSSSLRLNSESPSARSTRPTRPASSWRPSDASRNSAGSYGAKYDAGVTLWYCSTRPAGSDANAA